MVDPRHAREPHLAHDLRPPVERGVRVFPCIQRQAGPRALTGHDIVPRRTRASWPIARRAGFALTAVQRLAQVALPPFGRGDPWTIRPRRIVTHVLVVTALELRDPVGRLVPMEAGDALFQ